MASAILISGYLSKDLAIDRPVFPSMLHFFPARSNSTRGCRLERIEFSTILAPLT